MIQRFLYTALTNGLAAIAAKPELLDDLFSDQLGLSAGEVVAIKTYFVAHAPAVRHGYARSDFPMPVYAITLQSEGEKDLMIGDDGGVVDPEFDAELGNNDIRSALWHHNYGILCYSQHPDATTYMYEVAKSIILASGPYFVAQGIWGIRVSGADLRPDPKYLPEHLFARVLTFECEREFQVIDRTSRLTKAFAITGVHVDNSGQPSDGINHNVTPYAEE